MRESSPLEYMSAKASQSKSKPGVHTENYLAENIHYNITIQGDDNYHHTKAIAYKSSCCLYSFPSLILIVYFELYNHV